MSLDTENYQRAIDALSDFIEHVSNAVNGMTKAATDCLDASNNDANIGKHVTKLEESLKDYTQILAKAQDTLEKMQKQLNEALELGNTTGD